MIPQIKICGLSRPEDIMAVNEARADYAGFVFFEKSKRNVSLKKAEELLKLLDPGIQSVAVCVSPDAHLLHMLESLGFDILQIHGKIPDEILNDRGIALWQAVNIADGIHPEEFCFHPAITGYVVDGAHYGGGRTFGWEKNNRLADILRTSVREVLQDRKFILAGGLKVENVQQGIRLFAPDVVDVSSGVELDGVKNKDSIDKFIRKVRAQQ